jgi:hypothetical protein
VESGFVTFVNRARLELSMNGKKIGLSLGEWEQGWEWGSAVTLVGVVRLGQTGKEAPVVSQESYQEGEGIDNRWSELQIIGLDGDALRKLWGTSANAISASIQNGELRLETHDHEGWRKSGKEIVRTSRVRVVYEAGGFAAR